MAKIETPYPGKDLEKQELAHLYTAGRNAKTVQPLWKTVWGFLTKLYTYHRI